MASLKKLNARVEKLEGKLTRARQKVLDKANKKAQKAVDKSVEKTVGKAGKGKKSVTLVA